jgi:hypothetical protein
LGPDSLEMAMAQCRLAVPGPAVKATLPRSIRIGKGHLATVRLVTNVNSMEAHNRMTDVATLVVEVLAGVCSGDRPSSVREGNGN